MKVGQYVRCPIVLEENDNYFPRSFVLGKITSINELSASGTSFFLIHDSTKYRRCVLPYFC